MDMEKLFSMDIEDHGVIPLPPAAGNFTASGGALRRGDTRWNVPDNSHRDGPRQGPEAGSRSESPSRTGPSQLHQFETGSEVVWVWLRLAKNERTEERPVTLAGKRKEIREMAVPASGLSHRPRSGMRLVVLHLLRVKTDNGGQYKEQSSGQAESLYVLFFFVFPCLWSSFLPCPLGGDA